MDKIQETIKRSVHKDKHRPRIRWREAEDKRIVNKSQSRKQGNSFAKQKKVEAHKEGDTETQRKMRRAKIVGK